VTSRERLRAETEEDQAARDLEDAFARLVARALIVLAVVLMGGCAVTPTGPDGPRFSYEPPVSGERVLFAEAEWEQHKACVGLSREARATIVVRTYSAAFLCGPVMAAGCTWFPDRIGVMDSCWEAALSHELIHWQESMLGRPPDRDHSGAVWAKCDLLNTAQSRAVIDGSTGGLQ
jgi:hypothetical protein